MWVLEVLDLDLSSLKPALFFRGFEKAYAHLPHDAQSFETFEKAEAFRIEKQLLPFTVVEYQEEANAQI